MVCQLLFWPVASFHISAIFVSLQRFFIGSLFPAIIVAATKVLPAYLHVSATVFAAVFGGRGSAALPFAIGSLAQAKGVAALQPIILALLAGIFLLWLCFPVFDKKTAGEVLIKTSYTPSKSWLNIDNDLVEVGRRTIHRTRGG